jgi:hypothetical protein
MSFAEKPTAKLVIGVSTMKNCLPFPANTIVTDGFQLAIVIKSKTLLAPVATVRADGIF